MSDENNIGSEMGKALLEMAKQIPQELEPLSSTEIGEHLAQCNRHTASRKRKVDSYEFKERP